MAAVLDALGSLKRMIRGPEQQEGSLRAKTIAVAAQKGGVGKTTTSVHLAAALAMYHKRKVLLIDLDAQGHVDMSLAKALADNPPQEKLGHILLQKNRDIHEIIHPTQIDGLWIIPSDRKLNETEIAMTSKIGKEMLLKKAMQVAKTHFDVILMDCPPNLGNLTLNALTAADQVLIPCDLSVLSLDGVEAILHTIENVKETLNPGVKLLGLVRTRVDKRNQTMNKTMQESIEQWYGEHLLKTSIGVSTAVTKSQLAGIPIFLHDEKNTVSAAYKELASEIDSLLFATTR